MSKHKQITATPNPVLHKHPDTRTRPMFCPDCFEEHEEEVSLLQCRDTKTEEKYWYCPKCKQVID